MKNLRLWGFRDLRRLAVVAAAKGIQGLRETPGRRDFQNRGGAPGSPGKRDLKGCEVIPTEGRQGRDKEIPA